MAKKNTGSRFKRGADGLLYVRLSRMVDGKRERTMVCLETADEKKAAQKLARLLPTYTAGERVGAAPALRAPSIAAPEPERMPRFEAYARTWHAKRVGRVASAPSEIINLEKYAFPVDLTLVGAPMKFGELLLGDIRIRYVRAALERARDLGMAKGTVTHIRAAIRRVLQSAVEEELIPVNVAAQTRTPQMREVKKRRVILTDDEVMRFFDCDQNDIEIRLMGLVARCEGGMRTRDVTAWSWDMIDTQRFATCTVPRTKGGNPQQLEVPGILQAPLRRWWVEHGCPTSGHVFPVTKGARKGEARREQGVSFAKRLRRALKRAGVDRPELFAATSTTLPVDFHSFRRAFSTALAEAGVNAQQAMVLAGHADPRAHARYIMDTPELRRIPEGAVPRASARFVTLAPAAVDPDASASVGFRFVAPRTSFGGPGPDGASSPGAPLAPIAPPAGAAASNGHGLATDWIGADVPGKNAERFRSGTRDSNSRPSAWEAAVSTRPT